MKKISALFISILFTAGLLFSQPKLSSYPSARATIFLDFDGHFVTATPWNGGESFYCAPAGLNDNQITEIFNRVSEDFRPFDINITTDSMVYLNAPLTNRVRIIITPTSGWYTGVGGVSFTRSFTWGDGTPAFVFPDRLLWSPKIIAECISHESGHTLGLSHQAKFDNCSLVNIYNDGQGTGEIAWAPVMGNSYYKNLSGWNNGPTPSGCYAEQDNLSIIVGTNGFGYRGDDHKDNPRDGATRIDILNDNFNAEGIISTNSDQDAFEFNFAQAGRWQLSGRPFSVGPDNEGANLDVKIVLMDADYQVIATYDPQNVLDVSIDTVVSAGKYFVVVQGAGNQFAPQYGSLGQYFVSGNFRPMGPLPVTLLELKGSTDGEIHQLTWNLICDEQIVEQDIEVSYNGKDFKNLALLSPVDRRFVYDPLQAGDIYYRAKVVTISGAVNYSNTVSLKKKGIENNITLKSTVVTDKIEISSSHDYQFILSDINGKILKKGNGATGYNVINVPNLSNGIYIIQFISNPQRITHRVVKM